MAAAQRTAISTSQKATLAAGAGTSRTAVARMAGISAIPPKVKPG